MGVRVVSDLCKHVTNMSLRAETGAILGSFVVTGAEQL
jgi:hypothetical protein